MGISPDFDPNTQWTAICGTDSYWTVAVDQLASDGTASLYTGFTSAAVPSAAVCLGRGAIPLTLPAPGLACAWMADGAFNKIAVTLPAAVSGALPPGEYAVIVGVTPQGGAAYPAVYRVALDLLGGPPATLPTALSHAVVASVIAERCGGLIADDAGYMPSLRAAATWAALQCGVAPASPLGVADAELAGIDPGQWEKFLDACELRVLESAYNNFADVNVSGVDFSKSVDQLRQALKAAYTAKAAYCLAVWGIGARRGARIGTGHIPATLPPPGILIPGVRNPAVCPPGINPWTGLPMRRGPWGNAGPW